MEIIFFTCMQFATHTLIIIEYDNLAFVTLNIYQY